MRWFLLVCALGAWTGCDDGGDSSGGDEYANDTGRACSGPADCNNDEVCVQVNNRITCHVTCSGSVDECGARGACDGVGSVDVDICKPTPTADDPPEPEEAPKLPCMRDEDCAQYSSNAVCALWRGARECTIECQNDMVCNPPSAGGITIQFAECAQDEGADRTVCLPRAECFERPQDCYTFSPGGVGGMGGGFGGEDGFGGGFEPPF